MADMHLGDFQGGTGAARTGGRRPRSACALRKLPLALALLATSQTWLGRYPPGGAVHRRPAGFRPRAPGYTPHVKPLYTAVATASDGGRNGRAWTEDRSLELDLAVPEPMGGPGGGANPEQLFALGYSACFANAMRSAARRQHREEAVEGATVTARVAIGRGDDGRFELAVELDVHIPRLPQAEAEEVVELADRRCPYSNATRGNVPVARAVTGGGAAAA